jgi:hypothetical protein
LTLAVASRWDECEIFSRDFILHSLSTDMIDHATSGELNLMKQALKLLAALWLAPLAASHAATIAPLAAERVPFPDALDAAAVAQDRIDDIERRALVLGNGDLSGLLWERNGVLCLRVTKNDVWDARVDTSQDPPMLQVDIPNQKWKGGTSSPPSYGNPYPQPRCAAIIRLGAPAEDGAWQKVRAQGKVNEWRRQDEAGLMIVEGAGTVSAGYRFNLPPALEATFKALTFRISGNAPAQY